MRLLHPWFQMPCKKTKLKYKYHIVNDMIETYEHISIISYENRFLDISENLQD